MFEFCEMIDGDAYVVHVKSFTPGDPGYCWGPPENCTPPSSPEADFDLIDEMTGEHADEVACRRYRWIVDMIEEQLAERADNF